MWTGSVTVYGFDRALIEVIPDDPSSARPRYCVFDASDLLIALRESGDRPWDDAFHRALGPTGMLAVTDDGARFWLGTPTSD